MVATKVQVKKNNKDKIETRFWIKYSVLPFPLSLFDLQQCMDVYCCSFPANRFLTSGTNKYHNRLCDPIPPALRNQLKLVLNALYKHCSIVSLSTTFKPTTIYAHYSCSYSNLHSLFVLVWVTDAAAGPWKSNSMMQFKVIQHVLLCSFGRGLDLI